MPSAHLDTFARDRLPPPSEWPELLFDLPALQFPPQLNAAAALLDQRVAAGEGDRACIQGFEADGKTPLRWTYADVLARAAIEARLSQGLGSTLHRFGLPTRKEVDALAKKVDKLAQLQRA